MSERFDCTDCQQSLYGEKFIRTEDGSPHCVPCYNKTFTHTCAECKEPILHDCRELSYNDQHYHEQCLRCTRCSRCLADERFTRHGTSLLCNACFQSEFSSTCVACNETIQPGSRKMEYKGNTWHEDCFVCLACKKPIGGQAFVPDDNGFYCSPCYEDKFAPRCSRCGEILTTGGVTYRDQAFHRHCFVCSGCGTELAGKQFTTEEDRPYCVECFTKTYAQKCAACGEPITGFGEGKFVSFGERHWHQTCFNCSSCSASLVGVGFYQDEDRILCRDCSEKL